jgi:uncharacterized protein
MPGFKDTRLKELLKAPGCNLNKKDSLGMTPLIRAARLGQLASVKILIKAKADLDIQDHSGQTALMLADKAGHHEVRNLLIDTQANARNNKGQTGVHPSALRR